MVDERIQMFYWEQKHLQTLKPFFFLQPWLCLVQPAFYKDASLLRAWHVVLMFGAFGVADLLAPF